MSNAEARRQINSLPRFDHVGSRMLLIDNGEFIRCEDVKPLLEQLLGRPYVEINRQGIDEQLFSQEASRKLLSPAEVYEVKITADGGVWEFKAMTCVGTPDSIVWTEEYRNDAGTESAIVATGIEPRAKSDGDSTASGSHPES